MKQLSGCLLLVLLTAEVSSGNSGATGAPDKPPTASSSAHAKPNEPAVDIRLRISGAASGPAKVIGTIGSTNFLVDSVDADADGLFRLRRDLPLKPGLYYLLLADDKSVQFLVDSDQIFSITADAADIIGTAKLEGSIDNDLLYRNLKFEADFQTRVAPLNKQLALLGENSPERPALQEKIDRLVDERKNHLKYFRDNYPRSFFTAYKSAGQNPDLHDSRKPDGSIDMDARLNRYRAEFWDNTPLDDERLLQTPVIFNKLKTYITSLTAQTVDDVIESSDIMIDKSMANREVFKFVVNWIAIEYEKPKQMGLEAVFIHVVDKYFTDKLAFWSTPEELGKIRARANALRPSLLGKTGPDLRCRNLKGEYETLYDIKAPVTVVYFWNFECDHCKERSPVLRDVLEKYRDRGLAVYAVCVNKEEKGWRPFIDLYGLQGFHNVWDPEAESKYPQKYHFDSTPGLFVLDRNHKIVAKDLHPNQLEPVLDPLF